MPYEKILFYIKLYSAATDFHFIFIRSSGGSKGGIQGHATPLWVQILSFSCSFRPKKIGQYTHFGGWRPLKKILDPPLRSCTLMPLLPILCIAGKLKTTSVFHSVFHSVFAFCMFCCLESDNVDNQSKKPLLDKELIILNMKTLKLKHYFLMLLYFSSTPCS